MTATAEVQVCSNCGKEFGVDEARECDWCHSLICPKCGMCLCNRGKNIFGVPIDATAWDEATI